MNLSSFELILRINTDKHGNKSFFGVFHTQIFNAVKKFNNKGEAILVEGMIFDSFLYS
jgi:hypothetical protein